MCKRKIQIEGALNYELHSSSPQISFYFPFKNKFLILVSKETNFFFREGNIADELKYNGVSALRMRIPIILEKFIGVFAKIGEKTISFDFFFKFL